MDELSLRERIEDKIKQIDEYIKEVESFKPSNLNEYLEDTQKKAACERYIEKISESAVDLAILFIRLKKLESPEDDDTSFQILAGSNIITQELARKLRDLKGMRNRLAHRYEEVDDKSIFEAVNKEIEKDINEFVNKIKNTIREKKNKTR